MALNQKLYRSLQRVFGEVRIAKEGESMAYKFVKDPLTGKTRLHVISGGEDYKVCCPFCSDTRFRLEISHRWGTKDPVTGNEFGRHLMRCYNDNCPANLDAAPADRQRVREQLINMLKPYVARSMPLRTVVVKPDKEKPVALPEKCVPIDQLPSNHVAIEYLTSRHFDAQQLVREYSIMYCFDDPNPFVRGRIIIPFYKEQQLVGWQARYVGTPPSNNVPKYYTAPGLAKSRILYNYDIARQQPFGVIVEGVTDAWRVGPYGVALLGCSMSTHQLTLAKAAWGATGLVLLLDPDVEEKAAAAVKPEVTGYQRMLRNLSTPQIFKLGVLKVQLPSGVDPGDYPSREQLWAAIKQAAKAVNYPVEELLNA